MGCCCSSKPEEPADRKTANPMFRDTQNGSQNSALKPLTMGEQTNDNSFKGQRSATMESISPRGEDQYVDPKNLTRVAGHGNEGQSLYQVEVQEQLEVVSRHPMVQAAIGSVVILSGSDKNGKPPTVAEDLLAGMRNAGIKTWDLVGAMDEALVPLFPHILEKCATILVVVTNTFFVSQAKDYVSYSASKKKVGVDLFCVKGEEGASVTEGVLGLHFHSFFDLSKIESKTYKQEFKRVIKSVGKQARASASRPRSNTASAKDISSLPANKPISFDPESIDDPTGAGEAATGRVLLLYSWGERLPNGRYLNQVKVNTIKNQLMMRGIKVWMDTDHVDSQGSQTDYGEILALAIHKSWIVVVCLSNSVHVPNSPTDLAFRAALSCKDPGVSLFAIKLNADTDMNSGVYGLYMNMQLYYDVSMLTGVADNEERMAAASENIKKMATHIMHVNPPTVHSESLYMSKDQATFIQKIPDIPEIDSEQIYGTAELVETVSSKQSPAVRAAKDSIMLSYAWGAKTNGIFKNQAEVLALRDILQQHGFKCWIDLEWMFGNMDTVMTGVIETASCVIACIHPEYERAGSNAQKEWNYACKKKALSEGLFLVILEPDSPLPMYVGEANKSSTIKAAKKELSAATFDLSTVVFNHGCGAVYSDNDRDQIRALVKGLDKADIPRSAPLSQEPNIQQAFGRRAVKKKRGGTSLPKRLKSDEEDLNEPLPVIPRSKTDSLKSMHSAQKDFTPRVRKPSIELDAPAAPPRAAYSKNVFTGTRSLTDQFQQHPAYIGNKLNKLAIKQLFEYFGSLGDYVIRESDRHVGALVVVMLDEYGLRERKLAIEEGLVLINNSLSNGQSVTESFNSADELFEFLEVKNIPQFVLDMTNDDISKMVDSDGNILQSYFYSRTGGKGASMI